MKAKEEIPEPESSSLGLLVIVADSNGDVQYIDMKSLFGE